MEKKTTPDPGLRVVDGRTLDPARRALLRPGELVTDAHDRRHALPALCNAMTSPYLWVLALVGLVPATLWWDNAWMLCLSMGVFAGAYIWLYIRLVTWRRPRWLLLPSLGRGVRRD